MAAATPVYQLPYPSLPDPADVPADMQRLANRIEAAIAPGTLDGQVPVWDNTAKTWKPGADTGRQLAYAERTTPLTVNSVSEGAADSIVACPSITLDGATRVCAEFFAPQANTPAAQASLLIVHLFDNGASLGNFAVLQNPGGVTLGSAVHAFRFLTPSAAAHVFACGARVSPAPSGGISAGVGGAGAYLPAYLRISRA